MKYLHTMVRVRDLDASMAFYRDALGLVEVRRSEHPAGRFTLVYLAAPGDEAAQIELTYNWPDENGNVEDYGSARNFGHVAYAVKDIHATCAKLLAAGVTILRPPRDGRRPAWCGAASPPQRPPGWHWPSASTRGARGRSWRCSAR